MKQKSYKPTLVFVNTQPKIQFAHIVSYDLSEFEEQLLRDLAIRVDEIDIQADFESRLKQLREIYIDIALDNTYVNSQSKPSPETLSEFL